MVCAQDDDGCTPVSEAGEDTFLLTAGDFRGVATVQGGPAAQGFRSPHRANVATSAPVTIRNNLVARYDVGFASPVPGAPPRAPLQVNRMSVDGPSGSQNCPCQLASMAPDDFGDRHGPGTYTFHLTGAGTVGGAGDVYVGGADARLVRLPS